MKMQKIKLNKEANVILSSFEANLDTANPEAGPYGVKIIGYGEMSTVFKFNAKLLTGIAFKRMALFQNEQEAELYENLYHSYHDKLGKIGIQTPEYGCHKIYNPAGKPVLFLSQKLLEPETIGHKVIHLMTEKDSITFLSVVLATLHKVFLYNNAHPGDEIGIDGQLSNWSYSTSKKMKLFYLDTSTPLMKKKGEEQLNTNLFLRICPSSLVWVIKLFFLKDVVTRYYDFRLVIIDLIANLNKEKKTSLIKPFLLTANMFLQKNYPQIIPITEKEISSYYKEDALIWRIFLFFRKTERFFRQKILRRSYGLILPEKVER